MKKILVCTNFRANPDQPSCAARGSKQLLADLTLKIQQNSLAISLEESACLGFCQIGPNIRLIPNGPFFHGVSSHKIEGSTVDSLDELIQAARIFID